MRREPRGNNVIVRLDKEQTGRGFNYLKKRMASAWKVRKVDEERGTLQTSL